MAIKLVPWPAVYLIAIFYTYGWPCA